MNNTSVNHPKEIEVKLVYTDRDKIINWLKRNGFRLASQKEIKDSYFNPNSSTSMSNINSFYRIRDVVGVYTELTLKDKFQEKNGIKTRREINIKIDNAESMSTILSSLGCILFKEHFSKRDVWEKDEVKFEFIDYYKPAALSLIEVEGPDTDIIENIINALGNMTKVADENLFSSFDKPTKTADGG